MARKISDIEIETADNGFVVTFNRPKGEYDWDHVKLGVEHPQFIGLAWCGYWETTNHHSGVRDGVSGRVNNTVVAQMRMANAWALAELRARVAPGNSPTDHQGTKVERNTR